MALSDYAKVLVNDYLLDTPANTYIQFHVGPPGQAGTNNIAAANTRLAVTWDPATISGKLSAATVTYVTCPADETITDASIWDALTGGNCLGLDSAVTPVAVKQNDDLVIAAGNINHKMD